jgi:protoporphyrinogen oxidase
MTDGLSKRIGIIGAGISGLSAAYALAKQGYTVEVFQKEATTGGLIATFDFDGLEIEHFYHFLCGGDIGYFALCKELGLADKLRFKRARTGFYYDGTLYPFSTPLDLLRFRAIPFSQRVRFGLFALEAQLRKEWSQLDELAAKPWLIDRLGLTTYKVVWDPLLALKFGEFYDKISAAWVWHRIHRVAKSNGKLGYLEGGTALLLETLHAALKRLGVTIHTGCPVTAVEAVAGRVTGVKTAAGSKHDFDQVISTIPLPAAARLLPEGFDAFAESLKKIQYIGVVCLSFKLKKRVSPFFWLNVNDPRVPFNGIIEFTNLNPIGPDAGHVVYVPYYISTEHPFYRMDDPTIFEQSWEALKLVSPGLRDSDLLAHHIARAPVAQAICPVGFLNMLPKQKTPLKAFYLLDSTFLYPEDRTQSGHIIKSYEMAELMAREEP